MGEQGHFFGVKVGGDTTSVVLFGDELFPFEINTAELLDIFPTRPKACVFAFKKGEGRIGSSDWQLSLSGGAEVLSGENPNPKNNFPEVFSVLM